MRSLVGMTTATLTHRRTSYRESTHVMLFAERGNEHYGRHVWTLTTELPEVGAAVIEFAAEYYGISTDEAAALVNPRNIVDSAGAWDDAQFVSDLWQRFECIGFRTPDGAVVLDRESVALTYSVEE